MFSRDKEYQSTLSWLFQQFPSYQHIGSAAYKPTLENIRNILTQLGDPQETLKFVHVAGSNGKGSTCSMIASILTEAGYTTGLFTSPHIVDFTERIRINGSCIPEVDVVNFVNKIKHFDLSFEPSFFEITFAMALDHFKKNECDICIIETGLGGRLDATNIINPLLSIITNISLEHTQILGSTLKEIAIEKAGIIKHNIPVIIGRTTVESIDIFKQISNEKNAKIILSEEETVEIPEINLWADYQKENYKNVALALPFLIRNGFELNQEHVISGIKHLYKNTGFYGRLQIIEENPLVIFDVSHNTDGLHRTFEALKSYYYDNLHIIYGTSSDKDLNAIINVLPKDAMYYPTSFSNSRSMESKLLCKSLTDRKINVVNTFESPVKALDAAKKKAKDIDLILVTGSFFLLSDLFKKNSDTPH